MSSILIIENLTLIDNTLTFTLNPDIEILKDEIFLYEDERRLEDSEFTLEKNNLIYTLTPTSSFERLSILCIYIKTSSYVSNIIYLYHPVNLINLNREMSPFLLSKFFINQSLGSNNYKIDSISVNGVTFPSNIVPITICNEINEENSTLNLISKNPSDSFYKINLRDKFSEKVPNGEYIIKVDLN